MAALQSKLWLIKFWAPALRDLAAGILSTYILASPARFGP